MSISFERAKQIYAKLWKIDGFLAMAYKEVYFNNSEYAAEKTLSLGGLRLNRQFNSIGEFERYMEGL